MRLQVFSAWSREIQKRGKPAEQRWLCLEHWSGLSSLCKFGKRHGELLFWRFESLTNMRWKSLKEIFPGQSPTALCSCVLLTFCFVLWHAGTCVWAAPRAMAGEEGQQNQEHTHQYRAIPKGYHLAHRPLLPHITSDEICFYLFLYFFTGKFSPPFSENVPETSFFSLVLNSWKINR